jgi:NADP-dependent 3-hydroxy acid dehydrogenase YdfG
MDGKDLSIVTGASRGIGKAIALRLAKEGHDVMIFGRDENTLKNTKSEIGKLDSSCDYFIGDVADESFVSNSIKNIIEKYGKIDHLINNAGIGIMKKVVDAGLDDFKKQIDANLYGVFNFSHYVLPIMIKNKKGSIILIASLAGKNSFVNGAMYSATKHAALGFMRSLMLEVREYNIRVASICPGSVNTEFSHHPNKDKILQADDVAETVVDVIKMPVRALISEIDLRPTNPK